MKNFKEFRTERGIDLKKCNAEQLEALLLEFIKYKYGEQYMCSEFDCNGHLMAKVKKDS